MAYDTMMVIEIEGPLDELRKLRAIDGIIMERGASDLGGGRHKVGAFVRRNGVLLELQARKLTVRIVRDEAEVKRRFEAEREDIRRANDENDAGTQTPPDAPTNQQDAGNGPKGAGKQ